MAFGIFSSKKKSKQSSKPTEKADVKVSHADKAPNLVKDASRAFRVLKNVHVSERSSRLMSMNQYVFKVAQNASKPDIKKQIEKLYNVTVEQVRIVNLPSKMKQIGRHKGFRSGAKKAIVRLAEGNVIEQAKP